MTTLNMPLGRPRRRSMQNDQNGSQGREDIIRARLLSFVILSIVMLSSFVLFSIFIDRPTHLCKSEGDEKRNYLPPMEIDRMRRKHIP